MIARISEIRNAEQQRRDAEKKYREAVNPAMNDLSQIERLYELFKTVLEEMPFPPNPESPISRKKFIFIMIVLYSPSALCGTKTRAGLNQTFSAMFKITPSNISNNISDALFFYENYADFEESTDKIYEKMIKLI